MNVLEKIRGMLNNKNEEETEERIYILDTCALNSSEAIQIIEEASKVIILTGIIKELDDHKNDEGSFGQNIRAFGKKSRIDSKGEKYVCVAGYEKHKYQDDNIIDYCKKHKNVTILTCDNYLCNKAKAYGIPYIFPKMDEKKVQVNNERNNKEENPTNVERVMPNQEKEITFHKRWIRVDKSNNFTNYINVERQGKLVKTQDYTEGDLLYLSKYNKKRNNLEIHVYKIAIENNQYVAKKLNEYKLWLVNEIYNLHLSEELQDEIRSFFVKHAQY